MSRESALARFFEFAHNLPPASDGMGQSLLHYINVFSSITSESLYVVDIHKRAFCYVSPNAAFLCGYAREDALELGYDLYPKIVHPKDLDSVAKTHVAILCYISAMGERANEIAETLCVSYQTVRNQIGALFLKLNVNSMSEATMLAYNRHLIFNGQWETQRPEQLPDEGAYKRTRTLITGDRL